MILVFVVFYAPIIVGLITRFLMRKWKRGYLLSLVSALAACVAWLFVFINDTGLEYYGMQAVMVSHFAGGSLLAEVYFVLRHLFQRRMKGDEKGKATRMAALVTAVVWIVLAGFLVYRHNNQGAVNPDLALDYGTDTGYTQAEIDAAAKVVKKEFKRDYRDLTLESLRCSGDQSERAQQDYGADQGIEFLGSCRYADNPDYPDTPTDWRWLLIREEGGNWQVVDASPVSMYD